MSYSVCFLLFVGILASIRRVNIKFEMVGYVSFGHISAGRPDRIVFYRPNSQDSLICPQPGLVM